MLDMKKKLDRILDHPFVRIFLCAFVPMIVFGILLAWKGNNPANVYYTMLLSIFGSAYGIGEVIVRATPLIMTSLTSILPSRVGLANAGGEGQLACGAVAAAFVGSTLITALPRYLGIVTILAVGALFGMLWAGIAISLKLKLNMNETLMTILMNYVMQYIVAAMIYGPLRDPDGYGYPQTATVPDTYRFHMLFGTRANWGFLISLVLPFVAWFLIYKTRAGFNIRTIGGNQIAARNAGLKVKQYQVVMFLVAGLIAGLAGAILIVGVEGRVKTGTGVSLGFMGFLAAGIVKNNVLLAILASFLIAIIQVMGNSMEINTGLPSASIQILLTSILLTIMILGSRRSKRNE